MQLCIRARVALLLLCISAPLAAGARRNLTSDRAGKALKTESPCGSIHQPSTAAYRLMNPAAQWYSQIGQDARLEKILPNPTGFFIESGAADGETHSNSLHFEKKGWSGLLVEPHPHTFGMLLGKNRKAFAYPGALSTTGQAGTMYLRKINCVYGVARDGECSEIVSGPGPNTVAVPVAPLEELLACLGRTTVDFWSLDVEGVEAMIMKHFPFDKVEVGLMLIEMNKNEENNKGIEEVMASAGFQECGRTDYDRFYANPSYFKKRGLSTPSAC